MINNGNTLLKLVPFSPLYADDLQFDGKLLKLQTWENPAF
jgi:hypothetical protein